MPVPSTSSVPIHWSLGLTAPVPSEVANTRVAALEPRLPTIVTVVEIGEPVEFVNVSMVRAKSWLPVLGAVTLRETVSPERVCEGSETVRPLSVKPIAPDTDP